MRRHLQYQEPPRRKVAVTRDEMAASLVDDWQGATMHGLALGPPRNVISITHTHKHTTPRQPYSSIQHRTYTYFATTRATLQFLTPRSNG